MFSLGIWHLALARGSYSPSSAPKSGTVRMRRTKRPDGPSHGRLTKGTFPKCNFQNASWMRLPAAKDVRPSGQTATAVIGRHSFSDGTKAQAPHEFTLAR